MGDEWRRGYEAARRQAMALCEAAEAEASEQYAGFPEAAADRDARMGTAGELGRDIRDMQPDEEGAG